MHWHIPELASKLKKEDDSADLLSCYHCLELRQCTVHCGLLKERLFHSTEHCGPLKGDTARITVHSFHVRRIVLESHGSQLLMKSRFMSKQQDISPQYLDHSRITKIPFAILSSIFVQSSSSPC